MPLNLHQDCISRLEHLLAEAMGQLGVNNAIYLDWGSTSALEPLNTVLPVKSRQPIPLVTMLDDRPVSDFIADRITRELEATSEYDAEAGPSQSLLDFGAFADSVATARALIAQFASLPWEYMFSLRLPKRVSAAFAKPVLEAGRLNIGGGLSLVHANEALEHEFPAPQKNRLFALFGGQSTWETDAVYLQVPMTGYADRYGTTGTVLKAYEKLQIFLGLGTAVRLFRYRPTYTIGTLGISRSAYHVHQKKEHGWLFDTTVEIESTAAMGLEGFDCSFANDITQAHFITYGIDTMRVCFSHEKEAERILRAAQWLTGSYLTRNETLAFVQAMVAMEILLGDKRTTDMVGIGELLSNRCAYLIGDSQEERERILQEFRGLYMVRSEIVHSGKSRLSFADTQKYHQLLWMCERSLMEEIKLLKKNQPT